MFVEERHVHWCRAHFSLVWCIADIGVPAQKLTALFWTVYKTKIVFHASKIMQGIIYFALYRPGGRINTKWGPGLESFLQKYV